MALRTSSILRMPAQELLHAPVCTSSAPLPCSHGLMHLCVHTCRRRVGHYPPSTPGQSSRAQLAHSTSPLTTARNRLEVSTSSHGPTVRALRKYSWICQRWSGDEVLGHQNQDVGSCPWGSSGFREPSLADFGTRPTPPQAELRVKRSTTRLICTPCRNKYKRSVGGPMCASWLGHVATCPHNQHLRTDMTRLPSSGAHKFMLSKGADALCP